MLNVSIKLGEMEEKSGLAIAALNKSIRVLKKQKYRVSFEEKKCFYFFLNFCSDSQTEKKGILSS